MEVNEEHVQTLLCMGFYEVEVRCALKMAKNDLNDAVAILTNEHPTTSFDTMKDLDIDSATAPDDSASSDTQPIEESGLEFPEGNLYELENRVFTNSWSIPYKKEESLGKCLVAATRLAAEGLSETDNSCRRFLEKCMPECFQKLMTSGAVLRWGREIQEGIYDMLQLLIDLVAIRLRHEPIPVELLGVIALTFTPETEFHSKNKEKKPDKAYFEDKFGSGQCYATSPSGILKSSVSIFLFSLQDSKVIFKISIFAEKDGFSNIQHWLTQDNVDAPILAALLAPFGNCAEYLNVSVVKPILGPGLDRAVKFVQNLKPDDLKDKAVSSVCDMLASMKLLCLQCWPDDVKKIDQLRLDFVLNMLKSPHFNARMNALKEV
ncbi:hypothetical protein CAPTEDRAFT_215537 [Capitella teleta]|uniref:UBA domain-containing protein n=1 Tax=Capitella teleta TaxID=283909 RepID=R7T4N6_CAPTE|nr:hypothetical protein CAPTEDRAFT_215537 [Capitella teleta]|eukprot:ELT87806.1 hypothetical protein CAPTEDRAFT_215537 [Capitella teleta]